MNTYYILEGKEIKPAPLMEWAKWFEKADRTVKFTDLKNGVTISTVFLGLDHSMYGAKPHIFETMIFGGEHDGYQERYSTWDEAESGHDEAVNLIFQ